MRSTTRADAQSLLVVAEAFRLFKRTTTATRWCDYWSLGATGIRPGLN